MFSEKYKFEKLNNIKLISLVEYCIEIIIFVFGLMYMLKN